MLLAPLKSESNENALLKTDRLIHKIFRDHDLTFLFFVQKLIPVDNILRHTEHDRRSDLTAILC